MAAGMINISSTHSTEQSVSSCNYIMRPKEAILVFSTLGEEKKAILKLVEQYSNYEKIGNRELGIRGRHDAQVMKKIIISLPNELEMEETEKKLQELLKKSGIEKYPYLVCVHRGEKDGIVNRHAHINFFQRKFIAGDSKKERLFVQKHFAETIRGIYQGVFGFRKNDLERVRVARQEFWKYRENDQELKACKIREKVLEEAISEIKGFDQRGSSLGDGVDQRDQETSVENKINPLSRPTVGRDPEESAETGEESLAKEKSENKATVGPDLGNAADDSQNATEQEERLKEEQAAQEKSQEEQREIANWESIIALRRHEERIWQRENRSKENFEKIENSQRDLLKHIVDGQTEKIKTLAKQFAETGYSKDVEGLVNKSLPELRQACKEYGAAAELYDQQQNSYNAAIERQSRQISDLAHEKSLIRPKIELFGLRREQKERIAAIDQQIIKLQQQKIAKPEKPSTAAIEKCISVWRENRVSAKALARVVEKNKKSVPIETLVERLKELPKDEVDRLRSNLIKERVLKLMDKPLQANQNEEKGLVLGFKSGESFNKNIERVMQAHGEDDGDFEDKGFVVKLKTLSEVMQKAITGSLAAELGIEAKDIARVVATQCAKKVGQLQDDIEEEQKQIRRKNRRYGYGRGM